MGNKMEQYYEKRRKFMKKNVSNIFEDINFYYDIKDIPTGWLMTRVKNLYHKLLTKRVELVNKQIDDFNDEYQGYPFPIEKIVF